MIEIDLAICTFRSNHVASTLRSVAALWLEPEWKLHIIVADNDDTPSARQLVEQTAQETGLSVTYVHAPARNISIARNACLDAATAPLLAFIDDDELVSSLWLMHMLTTLEQTEADAVFGPVLAVCRPEYPFWLRDGAFHSTAPVHVNGEIRTGYSGNVLLKRTSPAFLGLRFRESLGRSGGEDTAFFSAAFKAGAKLAYASSARVTEAVSPERATLQWLMKRRFRSGQTHGFLLLEDQPETAWRHVSKAAAKAIFCGFVALLRSYDAQAARYWLLRGALHAGVVSRLLGQHEGAHYG